jgi:hypothetical protein
MVVGSVVVPTEHGAPTKGAPDALHLIAFRPRSEAVTGHVETVAIHGDLGERLSLG